MAVQWPLLIFSVLLGIASGSFVFLGIGELTGRFRKIRFIAAVIILVCLAVGGIASTFHLGHPERVTHLLGNLGSGLSKELFVVAAMGIVTIAYLVLARKDYPGATKVLGVIGLVLGIALPLVAGASYLMAARPAWDSFTLPLMYLGSGLGMGMLLMAGLVLLKGDAEEEGVFALKLALAGVAAMIVVSAAYVAWIAMAPHQADSRSIARLVSGDFAVAFWLGVVAVGLIAPTALAGMTWSKVQKDAAALTNAQNLAAWMFAACACSAVGAIVLRVIMYGVGTSVESLIYR